MMIQNLKHNSKYDILTPNGWEDFRGIIKTEETRSVVKISTATRSIVATPDHRFYQNKVEKHVSEFQIGNMIDTMDGPQEIISLEASTVEAVYDIFDAENHIINTNGFISHNCDEFAFVPPGIAKDFWVAIQPVLSTGGGCIITSTPKNDEDKFAEIWKQANDMYDEHGNLRNAGLGTNDFFPILVKWNEHPERDEEWAKPFRASLGPAKFAQEMECEFVSDDETLIDSMILSRLKSQEPEFYTGQVRWYREPEPNKTFLVGLDPCLGTGSDSSAIQVFQVPEMIQVAEWQHNKTDAKGQVRILMQILYLLTQSLKDNPEQDGEPTIYWTIENNTIGETVLNVIEDTGEQNFPGVFVSERKKSGSTKRFRKGLYTSNTSKLAACAKLKSLMETNRMHISSSPLIKELKNFVGNGASYSAKSGEHDDLVCATLLIVRLLDNILRWLSEDDAEDLREVVNPDDEDSQPMPIFIG